MPSVTEARTATASTARVRAWDLPTRAFHWTLVTLVVLAWVSFRYAEAFGDHTLKWHRWNGIAILVAIVWRVLWGFVGSSTSRFSAFLRPPWHAAGYAFDLLRGRERRFLGHNPLGSYMILGLLTATFAQGLLGLFTVEHNDLTAGPLYRLVSEKTQADITAIHVRFYYYVILALVAVHITANVLYGVVKKEPLIRAMVTGTKPAHAYEDGAEAEIVDRPVQRALVTLVIAAAAVLGGIVALGGKLL